MAKRCRSCCTTTITVNQPFTVTGCWNLGVPNVSITATQSGAVVASGTTDATGKLTLTVPQVAGTVFTFTRTPRWVTRTLTILPTTTRQVVPLTVATGYHCQIPSCGTNLCADPIKDTLVYALNGVNKTITYQGSSAGWVGYEDRTVGGTAFHFQYSFNGCGVPGYAYCQDTVPGNNSCCVGGNTNPCVPLAGAGWSNPTTETATAFSCPDAGLVSSASFTAAIESGTITVTE